MKAILIAAVLSLAAISAEGSDSESPPSVPVTRPNIVVILADDLGYGDVHALNPVHGKIPTPCMDKLAAEGMAFTDAHSSSAVCTPTRYGLLTGRYNWRSRLQRGVLVPYDAPLIAKERLTFPEMLRNQGYTTACIGKWHLGWNWPGKKDQTDFTKPVGGGPIEHGFDLYFGVDVPNYPPYCFIEGERTVGIPSLPLPDACFKKHLASNRGIAMPGWKLEAILPTLTDKACAFIHETAKGDKPYFLYLPLTAPHTPMAVTNEWQGKSGLGIYADFVMETDAMIGRVLDAVEKSGLADTTLVILASDNGCSPIANIPHLEAKGHFPSADRRGYKSDAWDGGHRVPLLIRWPGHIKAGASCGQLACLNDLMATCAEINGVNLPENAGEDSVSLLPLLRGGDFPVRVTLIHHSINGQFAIRQGKSKLILCPGSGGWSKPNDAEVRKTNIPAVQLYDMAADPGEKNNLQAKHPDLVRDMTDKLRKIIADGRSTPGMKLKNDVPIHGLPGGKEPVAR